MFKKNECKRCRKKISENYEFCPYCGDQINKKEEKEDWGMLGKDDFVQPIEEMLPKGLNAMFNFLVKNIDKQFNEFEKNSKVNIKPVEKKGISISISSSGDGQPKIKIKSFGDDKKKIIQKKIIEPPLKHFSEKESKEFSKLPKKEPKTNIRRLSNRIVYEIEMPGVNSINDISIIKLESSIEIKAIAKNRAYSKILPVNLPVINYNLTKEKLVLELKTED